MISQFKLSCPHRILLGGIRLLGGIDYCTNMDYKNHPLEKKYCDYHNCRSLKMTDKKQFTNEDKTYLMEILNQQFHNYYRINNARMSLTERLLFDDISRLVQDGFEIAVDGGWNNEC